MEQTAQINGSIQAQGLNYTWRASLRADEEDYTNYTVEASHAALKIGDSFESEVDEQLLALFLSNVEDAMPRADAVEQCKVDYSAQLKVGPAPILVKSSGDGFVTFVAPNGASVRLECSDFFRWSYAVVTTARQLQPQRGPRIHRIRRRGG
jgi:hypothetical protein